MLRILPSLLLLSFLFVNNPGHSNQKEIAITIDDLPFVGTTHNKPGNLRREKERFTRILDALRHYKVPATGFVIAGTIEKDQWQLLEEFKNAGLSIGNHTYSHRNLNTTRTEKYIENIKKADEILTPLMTKPKTFRYPYLAEGRGDKKQRIRDYLSDNGYLIAPVTIDSKDFRFNQQLLRIYWRQREARVGPIKRRYLHYIWRQTLKAERVAQKKMDRPVKQILLIHANLLNCFVLGDLIEMYQQNGYKIIPLEEALQDSYYANYRPVQKQMDPKQTAQKVSTATRN
jgi:peptidoglycan/xylan/chitin deacetylase (PgdA/CDA1 family)